MSSKKYATPLRIDINPSRWLKLLLFALHFSAGWLVFFLNIDFFWSFIAVICIVISGFVLIRKHAILKSPDAITHLIWDANNEWILERRNGVRFYAQLMRDSYTHSLLTILIFKPIIDEKKQIKKRFTHYQSVILLRDSLDSHDFRRLRVRLKVGKPIDVDLL